LNIYKFSIGIAIACFFAAFFIALFSGIASSGPFLIAFFIFLAIGFRGFKLLKGYSYSLIIFAGVTIALYYPAHFVELDGFKLATLIVPLIQLIMFGMGTSLRIQDFIGVVKTPKAVIIGVLSQFTIMPIIGFSLASISNFPPEIAAGIVLIGCSPSGLASNVMNYLAKANLALSITITSVTTLLAPLMTPLLMKIFAGSFVEINMWEMMWDIIKMVIIPIGAGLLFNKIFRGKAKWLHAAMPMVSMFGIALIITIITAAGRDSLLNI
jgi:BASS family bile acid:Na+ symporter